jgi:hypothetical protein
VVNLVAISLPAASRIRTLTVASNTSAVPVTVTGLDTCCPMAGLIATIAGIRST